VTCRCFKTVFSLVYLDERQEFVLFSTQCPVFDTMSDLFAPDGGWRVRILDLSGGAQDNITEEVGGFDTLMHANAFARRYVRDSVERCRVPGMSSKDLLEAWFAFGEDAVVIDAGEGGWKSATELGDFVDNLATQEDRDWRSLDPRRDDIELEEDDE
jgi:hypothetical protein